MSGRRNVGTIFVTCLCGVLRYSSFVGCHDRFQDVGRGRQCSAVRPDVCETDDSSSVQFRKQHLRREAVDAAAVVNTFAYQAGLIATRDGIAVEKKERNPYVNVIAVRERDKAAPWVAPLIKAYHSDEVRKFILTKYQGSVIPAF